MKIVLIHFALGVLIVLLRKNHFVHIMRMMQKCGWNEADCVYWKDAGWTGKKKTLEIKRPWK